MALPRPAPVPVSDEVVEVRSGPGLRPSGGRLRANRVHAEHDRLSIAFAPVAEGSTGYPGWVKAAVIVGGSMTLWAGIVRLGVVAFQR